MGPLEKLFYYSLIIAFCVWFWYGIVKGIQYIIKIFT